MTFDPRLALRRRLRTLALLWMAFFLLWLPLEDVHLGFVVALAAAASLYLAANLIVTRRIRHTQLRFWALWLFTGLVGPLLAVFLMVFKGGLHAHGFADFAAAQIYAVLSAAPWWLLAGLAFGVIWKWVQPK
ncbi:MAG: hypothetical protein OEZ02_01535 [Anaerolineae bacterium]|nr:hypothetical protein [Anaerolineae bacterium]